MTMSSWLGIDHGTKRIGVAVGDAASGIATPVEVVSAKPADAAVARIVQLAREYGVEGMVVGLPINMDGTEGPEAAAARQFAAAIEKAGAAQVHMFDERLSSFAADQLLAGRLTRKKRRARQDAIAAATMLTDFLASLRRQ
jgi:putative Holliday junction resolvase